MATLRELENNRLQAQERLDAGKDAAERNRIGQFATPPALALEIATYVRQQWRRRKDRVRFLDPALGTGAFYSALRQAFPPTRIVSATGVEVDRSFARVASALWAGAGLQVIEADFTQTQPPPAGERFNLVLTNPPYVRHHHLTREQKRRLQRLAMRDLGIRVSGLAGLYCYFLLLADRWIADGGLAAWLVPSEFMDVNYGQAVKRYLTRDVTLLHIHRFAPEDVQFADALVSSVVVAYTKVAPPASHQVRFTLGGGLLRPDREQCVALSELSVGRKWTNYPHAAGLGPATESDVTLGDLFTIKRGLATGANDFFILPREEAARRRIPAAYLKPILPSPRHLRAQVIEADADGYPRLTPVLVLIDYDRPEEELQARHPAFWEYLHAGKRRGIADGYLASRRSPWYSQERRAPAPFLCTYMGRQREGRKPFRFIWNCSTAVASNLYLLLYPKGALRTALARTPGLAAEVFARLQEIDTADFVRAGRVYGGGLYKLEPKELGRVPAGPILRALGSVGRVRQGELFALP